MTTNDASPGKKVGSGAILTIATAAEYGLRFLRNVILARLLLPEDFGLMGAILASVSALEAFAEVGLRQSVIQSRTGEAPAFLNAVWCLSVGRGLLLTTVALSTAPWIASYFKHPDATPLFRVAFAAILVNSLISPRLHLLEKRFRFGAWVLVNQTAGLSGTVAGILIAAFTGSVWSLVFATLIESAVRTALSYVAGPFRPRLVFETAATAEILRFAKGMAGLPVLMMIFVQADVFVLGRMVPLQMLGAYVLVRSLADLPSLFTSKVINPVLLPSLAQIKDSPSKLAAELRLATKVTALFMVPLVMLMASCSEPIIRLAYGADYAVAASAFVLLAVYAFTLNCASLIMTLYLAVGKPGIHRTASLIRTACMLPIIYPLCVLYGLTGAAIAVLFAGILLLLLQLRNLPNLLPLSATEYFATWRPGLLLGSIGVLMPSIVMRLLGLDDLPVLAATLLCTLGTWCWALRRLGTSYGVRLGTMLPAGVLRRLFGPRSSPSRVDRPCTATTIAGASNAESIRPETR